MKAVLISMQPQWCELIASGEKTIEVRKTRPKIETPFKCYIYMTATKERCRLWEYITAYQNSNGDILNGSQKVIGSFVCDEIIEDKHGEYADIFYKDGLLTLEEQKKYGKNNPLYGWHISDLKIYDKPKEIADFYKPCPFNEDCDILCPHAEGEYHGDGISGDVEIIGCLNRITRPPQSWCYIEV